MIKKTKYLVVQAANLDHDLGNKAGDRIVWVQWTQCDHERIAGALSAAASDASHFMGLLQIDEIPNVTSAIKGMVSVNEDGTCVWHIAIRQALSNVQQRTSNGIDV